MRTYLLFFVMIGCSFAASAASLDVKVTNRKSKNSQIMCLVFTSKTGFPMDASKADFRVVADENPDGSTICDFYEVPSGKLAVSVLEDLNGNNKMDTGSFGIPKEPWGVSKNAPMQKFGPPKFSEAVVEARGEVHLEIRLVRP
ncbi:MAG: DUF2141 domain-containing protein [Bdellovibrionales bacterium]